MRRFFMTCTGAATGALGLIVALSATSAGPAGKKVAYFDAGPTHPYVAALNKAFNGRAKELGLEVTQFDTPYDAALQAQQILSEHYEIAADVWSVTSYNELRRDALETERWNRLHPDQQQRAPYIVQALAGAEGPIIAATDYMKVVAGQIAPWLPGRMEALGTDGFGRSDNRQYLRRHFEVNAESIAAAAVSRLARGGRFDPAKAAGAIAELGMDPEKLNPARV